MPSAKAKNRGAKHKPCRAPNAPITPARRTIARGKCTYGRTCAYYHRPWLMANQVFLTNSRIARNLFIHPRLDGIGSGLDPQATAQRLAKAAIWLTPKSVAGFNAADFPELGPDRQRALQDAVQAFLAVANQVPADQAATVEQYGQSSAALAKMLEILAPYLATPEEGRRVAQALQGISFPPWVVN